ncbi:MAG: hypothetical protein JNL21_09635 [Myxococcales bacterium]|nr:hypothetical protein [Myxococcales bacterium]
MVSFARFPRVTTLCFALVSVLGCTKTEVKQKPGPTCEEQGGIKVEVDGEEVCEEKCDASKCAANNVCVGNRCKLACETDATCQSVLFGDAVTQRCEAATDDGGNAVSICADSPLVAQIGQACPAGDECAAIGLACPNGTPCDAGGCPAEQCKPLACQSLGLEDAEAYCTTVDCVADTDCPNGYYCGVIRIGNAPCSDPSKGDPSLPCIDPANNAAVGGTYQEGPSSLVQNACLKREPCAPCVDQKDCAIRTDMACVGIGSSGATYCAETCFSDDDCPNDFRCVAAAPPTAGFCVPKSETCETPATNNFCFNCLNDLDCGPAGPDNTMACIELDGGQRGCFDTSFPDTCTVDGDCPTSPSGRSGECLDEGEGLSPSDSVYQRCYVPYVSGGFQCWPK